MYVETFTAYTDGFNTIIVIQRGFNKILEVSLSPYILFW